MVTNLPDYPSYSHLEIKNIEEKLEYHGKLRTVE
jgi:hypothetical protein